MNKINKTSKTHSNQNQNMPYLTKDQSKKKDYDKKY